MYLLWERRFRRPNRVHPIGDKDTKSPAKVIKKKEKSPKVQKPKKPTRAERRKAEALRKQQALEQEAKEMALRELAEERKRKAAERGGAAWEGDNAGLSMMEQAAMFASRGDVTFDEPATPPKPETPPPPPPAPLPTVVAKPYAGACLRTQAPAYDQFSRIMSKKRPPPRPPQKADGAAYKVGASPGSANTSASICDIMSGVRSPAKKGGGGSALLLAAAKASAGGGASSADKPPTPPTADTASNATTYTATERFKPAPFNIAK